MRNKYGAREIIFLLVSSDDYTQYVIDRERTREAREKARLRRERQKAATIACLIVSIMTSGSKPRSVAMAFNA